jgi:hypothetical protein
MAPAARQPAQRIAPWLPAGDHLSQDYDDASRLMIFRDFNWYSVPQQLASVRKLLDYDWLRALPGHGRPMHLRDATQRLQAVSDLLQRHGFKMPVVSA